MNRNTFHLAFIFLFLSLPFYSISCTGPVNEQQPPMNDSTLHVLGYVFLGYNPDNPLDKIDLSRLTDLNIAFVHPDEQGHFQANPLYAELVKKAHQQGVNIFFSIGGGSPPPHLKEVMASEEGRKNLVAGIANFLDKYNFDGVDIDLENDLIDAQYAPFVYQVAQAVKPKGKLLTAALAKWNSDRLADSTLAQYDFINIMSYDATGSWNPDNAGPHSPYAMAVEDFEYYHIQRGIPAEKLMVGLPFYGYGFNGAPTDMYYRQIVELEQGSENKDAIQVNGGTLYYNGIPTIQQKVQFAKEKKARGVMIWEVSQDTQDQRSLLRAISEVVQEK